MRSVPCTILFAERGVMSRVGKGVCDVEGGEQLLLVLSLLCFTDSLTLPLSHNFPHSLYLYYRLYLGSVLRGSLVDHPLIGDELYFIATMPGEVIDRPNPQPLPSHLPDDLENLKIKLPHETLDQKACDSLFKFRRAASYIAAGEP